MAYRGTSPFYRLARERARRGGLAGWGAFDGPTRVMIKVFPGFAVRSATLMGVVGHKGPRRRMLATWRGSDPAVFLRRCAYSDITHFLPPAHTSVLWVSSQLLRGTQIRVA